MGKAQKKTGKGRLDKYYKLAKEQGYRARSAFKLIQLNKKYSFLETARCCIDLCAAPGGWLQVASKYMPINSIIVGVDLVPIKPIPRVSTFTADITTAQCRNLIRNELKDWKADIVLHDGAPNVGSAWVQDAYSQSELVLMSLKLAVEFLMKGGTFVTKVFRSADYNNLIWVFNQLFGKVEATKPPSSRNVSAEIFVVCRDFLAPRLIDPKFLDPKHVFKELSAADANKIDKGTSANNTHANVFMPEKKRRRREGYGDGDYTLFKKASADEFVRCSDPVTLLGSINQIAFNSEMEKEWLSLDITTADVKANCDDLKVLGKGDFRTLIKWRAALRENLGLDIKTDSTEQLTEAVKIVGEVDKEEAIEREFELLNQEARARAKRDRRKANETKARAIRRMQLQMTAPMDIGIEQTDTMLTHGQDVFDLSMIKKNVRKDRTVARLDRDHKDLNSRDDEALADEDEECDEETDSTDGERRIQRLDDELNGMYNEYKEGTRLKAREARKQKEKEEWTGFGKQETDEEESGEEQVGWECMEKVREFEDFDYSDSDSNEEGSDMYSDAKEGNRDKEGLNSSNSCLTRESRPISKLNDGKANCASQLWFDQGIFKDVEMDSISENETTSGLSDDGGRMGSNDVQRLTDKSENAFRVIPGNKSDDNDADMWDMNGTDEDELNRSRILQNGLTTAEVVTLAQQLVNREKTKTQLINEGFNRYSLNSKEDLPSWFLDDEAKHYRPNIPVTKEAMEILRAKQRALDARPIKKVAEAKARKKMKAMQKLQRVMKKAEGVNESTDITEREKAQQIQKLLLKGLTKAKTKKAEIKRIVAKGAHKGIKGRPRGIKGRYQMVDARMKKEVRARKRQERAKKHK